MVRENPFLAVFLLLKGVKPVFGQTFCINSAFVFCAFKRAQTTNIVDTHAEDRYRYGCNRYHSF